MSTKIPLQRRSSPAPWTPAIVLLSCSSEVCAQAGVVLGQRLRSCPQRAESQPVTSASRCSGSFCAEKKLIFVTVFCKYHIFYKSVRYFWL